MSGLPFQANTESPHEKHTNDENDNAMASPAAPLKQSLFHSRSEMAKRISEYNWSETPIGPLSTWPQALLTTLRNILAQRFPMIIFWGNDHHVLYNDAYIPLMGPKHPGLGQKGKELWSELWKEVEPDVKGAYRGEASWSAYRHLPMQRQGYTEETFCTWSMSPIHLENGEVGGILTPSFEVTERVLHERRDKCLRELGDSARPGSTIAETCQNAAKCFENNSLDVPFSLIYLVEKDKEKAVLQAVSGLTLPHAQAPSQIILSEEADHFWPITRVIQGNEPVEMSDLEDKHFPGGPWPECTVEAVALPIHIANYDDVMVVAILGVSPRRRLNEAYRNFHVLLSRQLANNLTIVASYEEVKRQKEALAEIDRAKTTFFSSVSHEFRTPLTLILGPVKEALSKDLQPEIRQELVIVHRNALRLLKLVTSLLDFSRIEAGRQQANYRPTDLSALIIDLCGVFRSAIERAGLAFNVDVRPLSEPVFVDHDMMEKIVYNLLSNALKCTLEGGITVSLRQFDNHVEFSVSDTGLGIGQADLSRIFERFYRIETVGRRSNEGTGIGLALTQELVKSHGGHISVQSELEKGTTFTVTLPLGKSHLPRDHVKESVMGVKGLAVAGSGSQYVEEVLRWLPVNKPQPAVINDMEEQVSPISNKEALIPATWAATGASPISSDQYILIADDNADMAEYLGSLLSAFWRVQLVRDGEEALRMCQKNPPGLILSDVMMPRIDGFELVHRIRANPDLRLLPIILISARAGEEARVEGLEKGADDYLVKPFGAKELVARVRTHLELGRLRNELEQLAKLSPACIFKADSQGKVVYRSNCILGLTGTEFAHDDTIHSEDRQKVLEAWTESVRNRRANKVEYRYCLPNSDRVIWVLAQWEPIADEFGTLRGFVGAITDVTERVEYQMKQMEEAEKNRRSQEIFIDMICHEIRNPLNAIYNNVDLLRSNISHRRDMANVVSKTAPPISAALYERISFDEEALTAIESCAKHQRVVTDDVLNLSKLKNGGMTMIAREFDPMKVVDSMISMFKAEFKAKGIEFKTKVEWEGGILWGDPDRLTQVLINLLSNAIKFTEKSPVRHITLTMTSQTNENLKNIVLLISVSDTGIGMTPQTQEALFKRFSQASIRTHREYGGSGLGLHICKEMIQVMGGDITVESEAGKGSTFSFTIRCERRNTPNESIKRKYESITEEAEDINVDKKLRKLKAYNEKESNLSGAVGNSIRGLNAAEEISVKNLGPIHVLLVEDNLINQRVLQRQLELAGFVSMVANNGLEALKIVENSPSDQIDVVLMDIEMPVMDGMEATQKIRKLEKEIRGLEDQNLVPILGVSGNARYEHRERALAAGMNEYIVKPYEKIILFKTIEEWAVKRRAR